MSPVSILCCAIAVLVSSTKVVAQDFPSLKATDSIDAISTSSGAITTPGGASVGKNLYCGGFYVTTGAATNVGGHLFYQGTSDVSARLAIYNSGLMLWGPGNASGDTTLYRDSARCLTAGAAISFLRPDGLGAIGMNRRVVDGSSPDSSRHRWQISYNLEGTDFWRLEHYGANGAAINTPLAVNAAGDLIVDRQLIIGVDPNGSGLLRVGGGADIKGTVRTKEVIVTMNGWADSVFSREYDLLSLTEVDAYIQAHRHLPNVPSEAKVMQSGVAVGDMLRIQMAKIEELTLYVIDSHKNRTRMQSAMDAQQAQLALQKVQLDEQQAKLDAILLRLNQLP